MSEKIKKILDPLKQKGNTVNKSAKRTVVISKEIVSENGANDGKISLTKGVSQSVGNEIITPAVNTTDTVIDVEKIQSGNKKSPSPVDVVTIPKGIYDEVMASLQHQFEYGFSRGELQKDIANLKKIL